MILITRPHEDAKAFAKALKKMGKNAFIEPMIDIQYSNIQLEEEFDEMPQMFITTSKHAKFYVTEDLPVASIPEQGKTAVAVFEWVLNNCNPDNGKIVYLRGNKITFDIAENLKAKSFDAEEIHVYQTTYPIDFSDRLVRNASKISLATFFSAETFKTFMKIVKKYNLRERVEKWQILALSPRIAELASDYNWAAIHVAEQPNANSMLKKIAEIDL